MARNPRVYARDTFGRFAKAVRGRRATRSLGKRGSRGGRKTNTRAGGGTIGGVPASKAAAKARTSAAEEIMNGTKIKK
jgi:hypothetical protein